MSEMQQFKNILCVMELGEASKPALDRAVTLAEDNQATLTVVDVIPRVPVGFAMQDGGPIAHDIQADMEREHKAWTMTVLEPIRNRLDIKYELLTGTVFLEVIRAVLRNGHDLVIKSPESPGWLDRFFAGDDMNLLRKCPCPVWMVKPETGKHYQRILAAVDMDDNYPPSELQTRQSLNDRVMEIAGALAVSEFAELHVVHAWEAFAESDMRHGFLTSVPPENVDTYVAQVREHRAQRLDELIHTLGTKLGSEAMEYLKPKLHLPNGSAREQIPALAKRLHVDCIVMGTVARTGIQGFIMGNTAETILAQIDCSVLAIKPPGFLTPVALDNTE